MQRFKHLPPPGELKETTRTPSHHVDEDYPAGLESFNLSLNEAIHVAQYSNTTSVHTYK